MKKILTVALVLSMSLTIGVVSVWAQNPTDPSEEYGDLLNQDVSNDFDQNTGSGDADQNTGSGDADQNTGSGDFDTNNPGSFFLQNPLKVDSIGSLLSTFLEVFTYLVVIAGILMLIYVGLRFVLAMGNTEEIKKRKNQLLWIVIGIALVIGARIIVAVVINTLQATGTVSPGVINSANDALRGR